jgi:3-oxoacyl-[acyl-carrier protein] reductase
MKLDFRGTTALILGGSSAMGLELAHLLLDEGLGVTLTHASPAGLTAIAKTHPHLAAASPWLDLADRTSFASLEPVFQSGVDYLVDLAQADHEGLLAAAGKSDAQTYFDAHVTGRLLLLKAATRSMLARSFGRLLHVSSTAAALPAPGQGFYAAAKNAAESLYLSMGLELGGRGLTSLSLRLGLVNAGRGSRFLDARNRRETLAERVLSTDQAAKTLCFLLSDQALGLTCTTITMDAGLSAQKYL